MGILKFLESGPDKHLFAVADNGVKVGELFVSDDGYMQFWPEKYNGGYWPAYMLREIANKLDELNKDWDEQIRKDMSI